MFCDATKLELDQKNFVKDANNNIRICLIFLVYLLKYGFKFYEWQLPNWFYIINQEDLK